MHLLHLSHPSTYDGQHLQQVEPLPLPANTSDKLLNHPLCAGIIVTPLAPTYTWGAQSVRIFDSDHRNYSQVATMSSLRWYPTVMTFADGNMLILGGNQAVSPGCILAHGRSYLGCEINTIALQEVGMAILSVSAQ